MRLSQMASDGSHHSWTMREVTRALAYWDDEDKLHELMTKLFPKSDLPHPRDFDKQPDPAVTAGVYAELVDNLHAVVVMEYFLVLNRDR